MRLHRFRALGGVMLALVVCCCTTLGPADPGYSRWAENQARKTVKVAQQAGGEDGGYYCGSAFLIHVTKNDRGSYTGLFLTAAHVVDLKTETTVLFRRRGDPRKYYARVNLSTIKNHPLWDAAVFQVTGLPVFLAKPLPIAKALPRPDQWVLTAGYPPNDPLVMSPGRVKGLHWLPKFGPGIMSNSQVFGGMSGGPVLDRGGRVLGHTVAKAGDYEHFFIPVHLLKSWLATVR